MRLLTILLVLLTAGALPVAADPIVDGSPPIDQDMVGDHGVGEEMCARPAATA